MVGSAGIGYWIAHAVFWLLLIRGGSERGTRFAAIVLLVWVVGYVGTGWVAQGHAWFLAYVAALDVVLVLIVFKGDVRLT
jgi:hypothetical protein